MTTTMNAADRAIAKRLIRDLIAAGHLLGINDGEETTIERSTDAAALFAAMGSTDEDYVLVYHPGQEQHFGWVRFIHGNEPGYVINDYTTNLQRWMAGTEALSDRLENDQVDFDPENIYGLASIQQSIEEDRK